MACFVVPVAEAIVTTAVTKILEHKEKAQGKENLSEGVAVSEWNRVPFSAKLKKLNGLLWGGSALLAFEHVWHGELQLFFPFLTGAQNPAEMFYEMSTVGVGMAAVVTVVWAIGTAVPKEKDSGKEMMRAK